MKSATKSPFSPRISETELSGSLVLSGDQRDDRDQRLSERHCEQRACHSIWPKARDDGADDSDGEHAAIHHVGGVIWSLR